jgi:hypothetical protein
VRLVVAVVGLFTGILIGNIHRFLLVLGFAVRIVNAAGAAGLSPF